MPAEMPVGPGAVSFESRRIEALSEYKGRLIIDWGGGERAWVQKAASRDKVVLEIRKEIADPPFPGSPRSTQATCP